MYFYNQMFNPDYVNPAYYFQNQAQIQAQQYEANQNIEVAKAVHAVQDLCKAIKAMDDWHQQLAFGACLAEMANQFNWNG